MNNHGVAVVTKSPSTDHAPPIGGAFGRSRPAPPAGCSGSLAGCLPAVTRFAAASPRWGACRSGGLASAAPPAPPRCGRLAVGGDPPPPFLRHCGRLRRPRARSPPAASARASPSLPAPVVSVGAAARWVLPRWAPRAGVCLCAAARPSPLRGGWLAAGWGRGGAPPPSARGPLRGSCRSGGVFRALRRAGCRLKPCAARAAFARDGDGWQKIKMHQSENWCK